MKPVFKYDEIRFGNMFDRLTTLAATFDALEVSGAYFYDAFWGEDARITVCLDRRATAFPEFGSTDTPVVVPLTIDREDIENNYWRALEAVLYNLDIPKTEVEFHASCQRDITMELRSVRIRCGTLKGDTLVWSEPHRLAA